MKKIFKINKEDRVFFFLKFCYDKFLKYNYKGDYIILCLVLRKIK